MMNNRKIKEGHPQPILVKKAKLSFNPKSWLSWLIAWATKSEWTHAAIVVYMFGEWWVFESDYAGTYPVPMKNWRMRKREIGKLNLLKHENTTSLMSSAVGKKYDRFAIFRHIVHLIFKRIPWRKNRHSAKNFTCSEYVAYCYNLPEWWKMKPSDLAKYLEK